MALKKISSLTGWCRQDKFILFFLPAFALLGQLGNGNSNPNPHCSTFASPHEPTLKPKACKRAAILLTHNRYNSTIIKC